MNDLFTQSWVRSPAGLLEGAQQPPDWDSVEAGYGGMEMGPGHDMQDFELAVAAVNKDINLAQDALQHLRVAHQESKNVVRTAAVQALRAKMDNEVAEVTKAARRVKKKVETLDSDNEVNRQNPGCGKGSATDRRRCAITASLGKRLRDLMADFQAVQAEIERDYGEAVRRRVYTVTGQEPEAEEIDHIIATGRSELLLRRAVELQGEGSVQDAIAEIQERHDGVRQLESSLKDLYQVFLDMAVLVESQGEMLDIIELQVHNAVEHMEHGNKQLVHAVNTQRSTRRWKCCCFLLVLVVAVIVTACVIYFALH